MSGGVLGAIIPTTLTTLDIDNYNFDEDEIVIERDSGKAAYGLDGGGVGNYAYVQGGAGETNDGVNLGTGSFVYAGKNGVNLEFRSVTTPDGSMVIGTTVDNLTLEVASDIQNKVDTGQNTGTGAGVWRDKNGTNLRYRRLNSNNLTITENTADITIDFDNNLLTPYATKTIPVINETANFTVQSSDNYSKIICNSGLAITATLDASALAIGFQVAISRIGAGQVIFSSTDTLLSKGGLEIVNQYGGVVATVIAANTWLIEGDV